MTSINLGDVVGLILMIGIIWFAISRMFPENPMIGKVTAYVGGAIAVFADKILAMLGLG